MKVDEISLSSFILRKGFEMTKHNNFEMSESDAELAEQIHQEVKNSTETGFSLIVFGIETLLAVFVLIGLFVAHKSWMVYTFGGFGILLFFGYLFVKNLFHQG